METKEIATRLAKLCEQGEFEKAQQEFYAEDVISIEPEETSDFAKETRGKNDVFDKIKKFESKVEKSYSNKSSEPIVAGNSFAFTLNMDIKMKGAERMNMEEMCVYEVKDGKIILEQFFV